MDYRGNSILDSVNYIRRLPFEEVFFYFYINKMKDFYVKDLVF